MAIISNVIWINPFMDDDENIKFIKELENTEKYLRIRCFKKIEEAIDYIKSIRFEETKIIVNGESYIQFIEKFIDNLKDIFIIPKIIIYSKNKNKFIENNKEYKNIFPRGLNAELINQFVGVQGIVTRISAVRPKIVSSCHYCENTKAGFIKEYDDPMTIQETNNKMNSAIGSNTNGYNSNTIPVRDLNQNPLTFEYGHSKFKDHQSIQIQEPPERTPVGQLPRSIEVILEDDLVDKVKPGDRIQINGVFKSSTYKGAIANPSVKTFLLATGVQDLIKNEKEEFTGDDLKKIRELGAKKDIFNILANSIAPGIYGNQFIKKALILQLLGGKEKNLESGTHLRGDINILMIGDHQQLNLNF